MKRRAVHATLATLPLVAMACGVAPDAVTSKAPSPVAFGALVREVARVPLGGRDSARAAMPVATFTTRDRVVVLDRTRAELRIFTRRGGALERVAGTPGDGPGQLRRPAAVAALDSGRFVVLDDGRRLLSIRDSLGGVVSEAQLPEGSFTSIVALPAERRVIVAGRLFYGPDSLRQRDLHEFTYAGARVASYGRTGEAASLWERAFSSVLVAGGPTELATATMSSNGVRLRDRRSAAERSITVASGWYVPLDYPSDDLLRYGATQQSASARVSAWSRQQRLLNGLFMVGGDRILARFQAFDPSGQRFFYYALSDRTGSRYVISRPTRVNVLEAHGDTLFWVATDGPARGSFVTGVITSDTRGDTHVASAPR